MNPAADIFRYERKFLIEALSTAEIEARVRRNPALFFQEYAPRDVNNIYLDSPDFHHYRANVDGHSTRSKIRIRWYGSLFGAVGLPVLEIKRKHGLLGTKESAPLQPFTVDEQFSAGQARALLRASHLPDSMRREVDHVEPALMNHYRRQYFRSADRQVRITLDSGLGFFRFRRHRNSFLDRVRASRLSVIEIKYTCGACSRVAEIAGSLPFRMTRMSKYVVGLDLLNAR